MDDSYTSRLNGGAVPSHFVGSGFEREGGRHGRINSLASSSSAMNSPQSHLEHPHPASSFLMSPSQVHRDDDAGDVERIGTPCAPPSGEFVLGCDPNCARLVLARSVCTSTKGLKKTLSIPSICLLHLQLQPDDRCRQQQRCKQLHVQPDVVLAARRDAAERPLCCFAHDSDCMEVSLMYLEAVVHMCVRPLQGRTDGSGMCMGPRPPQSLDGGTSYVVWIDELKVALSPSQLLHTKFLSMRIAETTRKWHQQRANNNSAAPPSHVSAEEVRIKVPPSSLCANHLEGNCRFSDECRYLHGCRVALASATPRGKLTRRNDDGGRDAPEGVGCGQAHRETDACSIADLRHHDSPLTHAWQTRRSHRRPLHLDPSGHSATSSLSRSDSSRESQTSKQTNFATVGSGSKKSGGSGSSNERLPYTFPTTRPDASQSHASPHPSAIPHFHQQPRTMPSIGQLRARGSGGQKWRHCPHRAPFKEYVGDFTATPPMPPSSERRAKAVVAPSVQDPQTASAAFS